MLAAVTFGALAPWLRMLTARPSPANVRRASRVTSPPHGVQNDPIVAACRVPLPPPLPDT
eukprot:6402353-Alexandrium_andersonii.AAC.1